MIPKLLRLQNFMCYTQQEISFSGLNLVCLAGPNGAGKSALLDAITWALWGKARTRSDQDIMRRGQSYMQVELTFELDGQEHSVLRRRDGTKGELYLRSNGQVAEGMREAQFEIDNLLRMDYDTFINSAFLLQGRADEFTNQIPSKRKEILATILGLDEYACLEATAKEVMKELQPDVAALHRQIEAAEALKETLKTEGGIVAWATENLKIIRADVEDVKLDLDEAQALRDELLPLEGELKTLEHDIASKQQHLRKLQADRDEAESWLEMVSTLLEKREEIEDGIKALKAVRGNLASMEVDHDHVRSLQESRAIAKAEMDALETKIEAIVAKRAEWSAEIAKASSQVESLEGGICPLCRQRFIGEEQKQRIQELEDKVSGLLEKHDTADYEGHSLADNMRIHLARIEALSSEIAEIRYDPEIHQALREELVLLTPFEDKARELAVADERAKSLREKVESLEISIKETWLAITLGTEKQTELKERLKAMPTNLHELSLRLADLQEKKSAAASYLAIHEAKVEELKGEISELPSLREKMAQLEHHNVLLRQVAEACGKTGVPALLIEAAVPTIEDEANALLGRMTSGRMGVRFETQHLTQKGKAMETLDIHVLDNGVERPYETFSGGEKFRIDFSIRVAISELLVSRAGASLGMLVVDEGFGSQDPDGLEALVQAIGSVRERFPLVMAVTHIPDLRDVFPQRIIVENGQAWLEGLL